MGGDRKAIRTIRRETVDTDVTHPQEVWFFGLRRKFFLHDNRLSSDSTKKYIAATIDRSQDTIIWVCNVAQRRRSVVLGRLVN